MNESEFNVVRNNARFTPGQYEFMEPVVIEDNEDEEETKDIGLFRTKMYTQTKAERDKRPNVIKHFYCF